MASVRSNSFVKPQAPYDRVVNKAFRPARWRRETPGFPPFMRPVSAARARCRPRHGKILPGKLIREAQIISRRGKANFF
jgi:hypothetical protein